MREAEKLVMHVRQNAKRILSLLLVTVKKECSQFLLCDNFVFQADRQNASSITLYTELIILGASASNHITIQQPGITLN